MAEPNIYATVQQQLGREFASRMFLAAVTDTSGDGVQYARLGQLTDGLFHQAADGLAAAVSPGDLVLVLRLQDGTEIAVIRVVG